MKTSFLKKLLLINLILGSSFCFAQKKLDVKYYVNDKQIPIEQVKFYMETKSGIITPTIEDGKLQIPKKMKDNFSLFVEIDGKTLKIGTYRPQMFNQNDAITVGRITDFSVFKKNWELKDTYHIDSQTLLRIEDSQSISNVIYSIVRKDVDVSENSRFIKYVPTYMYVFEVLERK